MVRRRSTVRFRKGAPCDLSRDRNDPEPITCGIPELGRGSWPGPLCGPLVLAGEAAEDGPALDPLPGEISGGVVGPGRAEMAAAMGPPPVVMGLILGQDRPQMPRRR